MIVGEKDMRLISVASVGWVFEYELRASFSGSGEQGGSAPNDEVGLLEFEEMGGRDAVNAVYVFSVSDWRRAAVCGFFGVEEPSDGEGTA